MKYDAEVSRAVAYWGPRLGVDIPPALVHAVIQKESTHGLALESREPGGRRSFGPMMVLDSTARGYGVTNPEVLRDPALGIMYGVRYLGEQIKRFRGDLERAISAYNTGPGNAKRNPATGRLPNQAAYVDKVLAFWRQYQVTARAAAPAGIALALLAVGLVYAARRRRAA